LASGPYSPGQHIDGFRLEEQLHRGGMGVLWRVSRDDLPTPAIMKIPILLDDTDPTAIVSFEVEQMLLPRLRGVHVPRFYAASGFEQQPYLVMELIESETLRSRANGAPLPADDVARIGARIATALHELHRQKVIHLDLKPSNVMFRPTGEAVLIDFGLSRHDQLPDLLAEEFRLPMGTGPYISPEQVQQHRNDPRSDLFSLGVVLYSLATGEHPFGNPTTLRGLRRRLTDAPRPPRAVNPQIPPWLQEIILHCLEVDPDRRYSSAAQVALDLSHPASVTLTERAGRTEKTDGIGDRFSRWFRSFGSEPKSRGASQQLARAPIVMAAVDLSEQWQALSDELRSTVRRVLQTEPGARLSCVTVLKTARIGMDETTDGEGRNLHILRLVELKHWSRPLELPAERVTHHVLAAPDPASALLDYAHVNHVDQIVIGSRGSSSLRRYLGSISARVVAEATCTVTVVKPPRPRA